MKKINNKLDSVSSINKSIKIPTDLFKDRNISMLETIVLFLKNKDFQNKDIAKFLNRDPKTISSVLCRIKTKLPKKTKKHERSKK